MSGTALQRMDRINPYRDLMSLQNRLNHLFGNFSFEDDGLSTQAWMPRVDIYESPDAMELTLEVPGIAKDQIRVTSEDNRVTVSGERRLEHEDTRGGYHRVERSYGSFERSFTLPTNVDPTTIAAQYRDGLLVLTLPKRPDAKPRRIEIE
jgi:HSP20 family protein